MQNFINAFWSAFNGFVQLRSALEIFFFLHDNVPAHKAASVCQFLTPKNVTTFYPPPPVLSRFISARLFSVRKLKMKLKGLHFADVVEIQVVVTDELQMVQKEEFSAAFQKLYHCAKACIYAKGAYFELKKKICVFLTCLRLFKRISPKTFGLNCVFAATLHIRGRCSPNMNHSPSQLKQKFRAKKINKHIFQKLTAVSNSCSTTWRQKSLLNYRSVGSSL
jgi:hypothetical protein